MLGHGEVRNIKLVVELAEKESNRSWARYSVMFFASIGVLAVQLLIARSGLSWINAIPCLVGMVASIVWIKLNKFSRYYENRWNADIEAIIASDKTLFEWVRGRNLPRIRPCFSSKTALFYNNLVPYAFLLLWAAVFLSVVVSVVWGPTGDAATLFKKRCPGKTSMMPAH